MGESTRHRTKLVGVNGEKVKGRVNLTCSYCGTGYSLPNCHAKRLVSLGFCSNECKLGRDKLIKESRKRECLWCGKEHYPRASQIRAGGGKYCSHKCLGKSRTGDKNPAWNPDVDAKYAYTKHKPDHRIVMENFLGRALRGDEIVHHMDENGRNNDILNLMLVTHSEHMKIHRELRKRKR